MGEKNIASVDLRMPGIPVQSVAIDTGWQVTVNGEPLRTFGPESALFLASLALSPDTLVQHNEIPALVHETYEIAREQGAEPLRVISAMRNVDVNRRLLTVRTVRQLVGGTISPKHGPVASSIFALRKATPFAVMLSTDTRHIEHGAEVILRHHTPIKTEFLTHYTAAYKNRFK